MDSIKIRKALADSLTMVGADDFADDVGVDGVIAELGERGYAITPAPLMPTELRAGDWAYVVDELGGTFAFADRAAAVLFFISEEDAQNLCLFRVRVPRDSMTLEQVAEYACTHGPTIEDEDEDDLPGLACANKRCSVKSFSGTPGQRCVGCGGETTVLP